ncbi:MAG: MBL fold metallo-hydrolase RNA specificity domain-containing protein [Micavibrio sp.]
MRLTFIGATETVTGSKYLLEHENKKILIDCGLFQGPKELRLRNWDGLPFNPAAIDAVVLTHAHIDHSGYIPKLVKAGFRGPIYCTEATFDLCKILLPDSGHLQEEDAESANREGWSRHHPALPLYTEQEARDCLKYFKPLPFGQTHTLEGGLSFTLHRAGHILGAAFIRISDGYTSILFSGDIGRLHNPIMKPPAKIQDADYLVVESTYGDRLHNTDDPTEDIEKIVCRTVARGGTLVIPAFAVGRAQMLLYHFYVLKTEKRIPNIPVYLDSPMAINTTELLHRHMNDHRLSPEECAAVCNVATYTRTVEESKAIGENNNTMPKVIISASGMATGGRVLHHLKHYIGDPRNTILLAGFQAAGTRGDRLARGEKEIKIHGHFWPVRAEIVKLDNMSAHADYSEILTWLENFSSPPRRVFVTHGEIEAAEAMKEKIEEKFGWNVTVPSYMHRAEL